MDSLAMVLLVGELLITGAIGLVGWRLFEVRYWSKENAEGLVFWIKLDGLSHTAKTEEFARLVDQYREKRNEYLLLLGQVMLGVLLATIVGVLLLARAISAEAGLPILAGIAGFVIGKGGSMRNQWPIINEDRQRA